MQYDIFNKDNINKSGITIECLRVAKGKATALKNNSKENWLLYYKITQYHRVRNTAMG